MVVLIARFYCIGRDKLACYSKILYVSDLAEHNRKMDNTRDPTNDDHDHREATNNDTSQQREDEDTGASNSPALSQDPPTDVGEGICQVIYKHM